MVQKENLVLLVLLVHRQAQVLQVLLEQLDLLENRVLQVLLVHRQVQVPQVLPELQVLMGLQAQLVQKEIRVTQMVLQVCRVLQVLQDLKRRPVPLVL